jgi:hypothetical protein
MESTVTQLEIDEGYDKSFDTSPFINFATEEIYKVWGDLNGPVHIIVSAYSEPRWNRDFEQAKALGTLPDSGETAATIAEISKWLTNFPPLIPSGDVYALHHIASLLSLIYSRSKIKICDADTIRNSPERLKELYNNNVILIGSPWGNTVADLFLDKAKLGWIFPKQKRHIINRFPDDSSPLMTDPVAASFFVKNTLKRDLGVFLRGQNPFNAHKVMFAAMGVFTWGTQGASSLACSISGCKDLIARMDKTRTIYSNNVNLIGYVEVEKDISVHSRVQDLGNQKEPDLCFRIVWPEPQGRIERNPHVISNMAEQLMRDLIVDNSITRHFNVSKVLLTVLLSFGSAFFISSSLFPHIFPLGFSLPFGVVLFVIALLYLIQIVSSAVYPKRFIGRKKPCAPDGKQTAR